MSIIGFIKLMEIAKQGAKFGTLTSQNQQIDFIDNIIEYKLSEEINMFLLTNEKQKYAINSNEEKTNYNINRYTSQYLWLYENLTKNSSLYNIPIAKEIIGSFEPKRLLLALEKLLRRYGSLSSKYKLNNENISVNITYLNEYLFKNSFEDICDLNDEDKKNKVKKTLDEQCHVSFDLSKEYPIRCKILKTDSYHHYLFLTFHHCAVDGWAVNLLVDELSRDYNFYDEFFHYNNGYTFFNFLENPFLQVTDTKRSLAFWSNELSNAPEKHNIKYDDVIKEINISKNIIRESITGDLQNSLTLLAKDNGTTLFTLLHSAFALLLSRDSSSDRIVIGSPVANRNDPILNTAIGSFVNTVAYQFHIIATDSFNTFLQRNNDKFTQAFQHQGLPFSYLVEQIKPARGKFHPIFQIMFVCQHRKNSELEFGTAQVNNLQRDYAPPKFDLVLEVISNNKGIQLEWQYNSKLFSSKRINKLSNSYLRLLKQVVQKPTQAVSNYSLSSPLGLKQLYKLSVGQQIPQLLQKNLIKQLNQSLLKNISHIALFEGEREWSYGELFHNANIVACWLEKNTSSDALIAIDISRCALQAIAALGVIISGRTYLPITESLPDIRVAQVIKLSGCSVVLQNTINNQKRYPQTAYVQNIQEVLNNKNQNTVQLPICKATNLAYIIYTSGTTGLPKGVAIEHGAVTNTLLSINKLFNINCSDNILALSDFSFDLSVYDLFGSWLAGATVTILSSEDAKEPSVWVNMIRKRNVTIWNSVPAMLQMLIKYCEQENIHSLTEIRHIWLSGDRISPKLVYQAYKIFPNASITSLGGATECSIWSIYYPLSRKTTYRSSIPYGVALPNQSMWVLTEDYELCDFGITGDIYIGGAGLAREYWGDTQITNNSFIVSSILGKRLYRTGDRGRWHPDGYIEFLGREDQQVKIQGSRVELGDIESSLRSNEIVLECCVISCEAPNKGTSHLEAFVKLTNQKNTIINIDQYLNEYLSLRLPNYMLPTFYYIIDEFPLSNNGKLDRSALISLKTKLNKRIQDTPLLMNDELSQLRLQLALTLKCHLDDIDINTNFFNNGGSSLLGITFLGKIKNSFKIELTLAEVLNYKNLYCLYDTIKKKNKVELSVLFGPEKIKKMPNVYFIHGAGGQTNQYNKLIDAIDSCMNVYTISSPQIGSLNFDRSIKIQDISISHLEMISPEKRASSIIVGWSLGGHLAMHMANESAKNGFPFAHAFIIDSSLPSTKSLSIDRTLKVKDCFQRIFNILKLPKELLQYKQIDENGDFLDVVKTYYDANKNMLHKKMDLAQVNTFCIAIKNSFYLTENISPLPKLSIPLSVWLGKNRKNNRLELTRAWEEQSSHSTVVLFTNDNHYQILDNNKLFDSIIKASKKLTNELI